MGLGIGTQFEFGWSRFFSEGWSSFSEEPQTIKGEPRS